MRKEAPVYDAITTSAPVIICGFGRVGQIIGRVLRMERVSFVALEKDNAQIEVVRRFGGKVFYGDPTRPELLRAAGAETARLLVVAVEGVEESLRLVDMARRVFPDLRIVARARNRRHAHLLMERGIDALVRDTFHSSLRLAALSLQALDVPKERAERAVALFATHDERLLAEQLPVWRDEAQMIQTVQQATDELQSLFEADVKDGDGSAE
jgi:CPA2 family monovalent cation:H+ antiporter-2/glutathione-regulated potassium-efflux system protein KefB